MQGWYGIGAFYGKIGNNLYFEGDARMWLGLWLWIKTLRSDFLLLLFAWRHPQTPRYIKAGVVAALAYLVSPVDFLPDLLPGVGMLDDLTVVGGILYFLVNRLPPAAVRESQSRMRKARRWLPLAVGALTALIVLWIALLCWGVYRLLFQ